MCEDSEMEDTLDTTEWVPERVWITLDRAMLCLDCDTIWIVDGPSRCPQCGCAAFMPIATWIGSTRA